jgi:hypothetical protein
VRFAQGTNPFFIQLLEQLYLVLVLSWGIIVLVGHFIAMFLIAFGFVIWLTDRQPTRGKRMILGGGILFFIMQWMAISSPWILSVLIP